MYVFWKLSFQKALPSTEVIKVTATDPDNGLGGLVRYTLEVSISVILYYFLVCGEVRLHRTKMYVLR